MHDTVQLTLLVIDLTFPVVIHRNVAFLRMPHCSQNYNEIAFTFY